MRSAAEIAEAIREHFNPDYARSVHPDVQHLHNMALEVAKHLDVEPTALMINHISGLITQHVERPSAEYPKMFYHHGKRIECIVNNAQEEDDLGPEWVAHHWMAPGPERRHRVPLTSQSPADHHQEPSRDGSEESQSRH